jgi:hypothetical protein
MKGKEKEATTFVFMRKCKIQAHRFRITGGFDKVVPGGTYSKLS